MLTLIRDNRTETAILGRLFLGGVVIAYTLENASRAQFEYFRKLKKEAYSI